MMNLWAVLVDWFMGLGASYGVDPIIFGSIYVGAIPFFSMSVAWLVRNIRRESSTVAPTLSASFFALSAYLYLFWAGENLPLWVYGAVAALVAYGAFATVRTVRDQTTVSEPSVAVSSEENFDVIVIGGGAGGLTAAGVATNIGARTLMIERDRLGGDCTWHGCVPSKALLKSADVAHKVQHASEYGVDVPEATVNFQQVMERVRTLRQEVYEDADAPEIFEDMGIEVAHGTAHFVDDHTVAIDTDTGTRHVRGDRIVVATGARAMTPPIDGLNDVEYLTNHSLFEIDEQPDHLAIIGAGPIGIEMAQAFARLGSQVTVLEMGDRILRNDHPELTAMLHGRLEDEGVRFVLEARVEQLAPTDDGRIRIQAAHDDGPQTIVSDDVLIAAGRVPNVEDLNLDAAGVAYSNKGIPVDDSGRTNQSHILAVGDVTGRYQFTHMSEHMAKTALTKALLKVPASFDTEHVPWVTYTDPELAHLGATKADLESEGVSFTTYRFPYSKVDRAITDGDTLGEIKVYATAWNGKILGASVLGARAGELISEFAVAMRNGVTLRSLSDTIHPYPSYGLAVRRVADQWYAQKQSARITRWVQRLFGYSGPVIEPDPERVV
ncbi:MAG: FAD-dependent oxidoreductase [Longimonas sp.]|uniref:dihydrolipoyl dehydrogenase family protein n=1 Tax=Longimonas sp. TaxID=2039626 RepID=UPI003975ED3E